MPKGSGSGQGGKDYETRELANRVRTLTLQKCEIVLKKGKGKLYEAVLLKLAGSVLPRLSELSGPEGKPIPLLNVLSNHSDKEDSGTQEED